MDIMVGRTGQNTPWVTGEKEWDNLIHQAPVESRLKPEEVVI
jgi:hypothetical protein